MSTSLRYFNIVLLSFCSTCFANAAFSIPCSYLFEGQQIDLSNRVHTAEFMARQGIPGMWVTLDGQKEMPAALLHQNFAEKFRPLYENSFSLILQMQPQHSYDHGLVRVRHTLIDADEPGARYFGELWQTGLSGFDIYENSKRRIDVPETRIEFVVPGSKDQIDVADFYHRVRRAAMIVVPSQFNKKIDYAKKFNVVTAASEQCFTFSYGQSLDSIISHAAREIQNLSGKTVAYLDASPDLQAMYKKVRNYILNLHIDMQNMNEAAKFLGPNIVVQKNAAGISFLDEIATLLPAQWNDQQRIVFANWYIGYHAAQDYKNLLEQVGMWGFAPGNPPSEHISLIVLHDTSDGAEANFRNGSYQTAGRSYAWAPRVLRRW